MGIPLGPAITWYHFFSVFIDHFLVVRTDDASHIFGVRVAYLNGVSIKDFMQLDWQFCDFSNNIFVEPYDFPIFISF